MRTARLPNVRILVADTRCQYWLRVGIPGPMSLGGYTMLFHFDAIIHAFLRVDLRPDPRPQQVGLRFPKKL